MAGLDEPDGGTVRIAGQRLSRRPEAERAALRARLVGVLYQQSNLVGHLSIAANVALAQRLAGRTDGGRARELVERCGITHRAHALPAQLSGGELARAGLAVALAADPSVVLADEPTGELDGDTARRVLALLRERAGEGAAVLVVTHNAEVAAAADRRDRAARRADRRVSTGSAAAARPVGPDAEAPGEPLVVCREAARTYGAGRDRDGCASGHVVRGADGGANCDRRAVGIGQVDAAASHGRAGRPHPRRR